MNINAYHLRSMDPKKGTLPIWNITGWTVQVTTLNIFVIIYAAKIAIFYVTTKDLTKFICLFHKKVYSPISYGIIVNFSCYTCPILVRYLIRPSHSISLDLFLVSSCSKLFSHIFRDWDADFGLERGSNVFAKPNVEELILILRRENVCKELANCYIVTERKAERCAQEWKR